MMTRSPDLSMEARRVSVEWVRNPAAGVNSRLCLAGTGTVFGPGLLVLFFLGFFLSRFLLFSLFLFLFEFPVLA